MTGRPVALTRLFGGLLERTIPGMTRAARAVLADALRLGPDERAELAAEVLASLDGPADAGAEAAWEQEIRRRTEAIDAGTVESESWDDVKNRIEKETLGRWFDRSVQPDLRPRNWPTRLGGTSDGDPGLVASSLTRFVGQWTESPRLQTPARASRRSMPGECSSAVSPIKLSTALATTGFEFSRSLISGVVLASGGIVVDLWSAQRTRSAAGRAARALRKQGA